MYNKNIKIARNDETIQEKVLFFSIVYMWQIGIHLAKYKFAKIKLFTKTIIFPIIERF